MYLSQGGWGIPMKGILGINMSWAETFPSGKIATGIGEIKFAWICHLGGADITWEISDSYLYESD